MDLGLTDARAIVTGGSSGLGLAVARALVEEGARVALVARGADRLASAASELAGLAESRGYGTDGRVIAAPADTSDDASVRDMVERVVEQWGGVDVLVNAAAQPSFTTSRPALADLRDLDVATDFDVKVLGYLRCARAVAPFMTAQGTGSIVSISGLNTFLTGSIPGTIRNVAVSALTANLADELGPHGIAVTAVHPGLVETERTPQMLHDLAAKQGRDEFEVRADLEVTTSLHRIVTAAEVAGVVAFLCSRHAAAITGSTVAVAGGHRGHVHY